MTSRPLLSSLVVVSLLVASVALGQEQTEDPEEQAQEQEQAQAQEQGKNFDLVHDTGATGADAITEDDIELSFEPHIEAGKIEVSMTIGFLNLNQTLLQHDSIIYKIGEDNLFWGDVDMVGEGAFNPVLHLGYTLTSWFTIEGTFGISFSEYLADITNRFNMDLRTGMTFPDPALGEFDAEHRSLVTMNVGVNALWYPLNMGDRVGRFNPYLQGGFSRMTYDMNSNYTDGPVSTINTALGGGIRFIADELISIRLDVTLNFNRLEFTPSRYFETFAEDTIKIPLITLPDGQQVTEFEAQDMMILSWGLGFFASF